MLVGAASGVVLLVPLVVGASGVLVGACGVDLVVELLVGDSGVELVVELVVWRSKKSQLINEDSSCPGEEVTLHHSYFSLGSCHLPISSSSPLQCNLHQRVLKKKLNRVFLFAPFLCVHL